MHAHEDCSNPDRHGEFEYKSFSRIFSTSRLISQEAPCIFWGTNQFCFEDAAALKRFLSILRRLNTKNKLKHLVIEYSIGAGKSTEWAQIGSQSTLSALRGLETLEFHVQFSGWVRAEPRATIIDDCLEPFDNLRLLNLKKVLVSISYDRIVSKNCFERHELQATAETFRQRLLDPVITPQEYLADSIRKLKRSLRNTEESVKDHTNQMQDLQQKVDAGRFKAERAKVEINELQAMVQRNDTAEIEKVLQTDQGGVFSEEE